LPLKSSKQMAYKEESHGFIPWLLFLGFSPDLRIAICMG
jgi:hypothetical protein